MTDRTIPLPPSPRGRRLAWTAGALAGALLLAACGSSSGSAPPSASGSASGSGSAQAGGGAGVGQRTQPGASGTIAEVQPGSFEVQDTQAGQTTVNYTAKTGFTHTKTSTLAAVHVGSCVQAFSTASSGGGSTGSAATAITATTVTVTAAASGQCTGGFARGGQQTGPSGGRTGFPSAFPSRLRSGGARPSGAPSGAGRGFGDAVFGSVTAMSGSTFTVKQARPAARGSAATPRTITVTTTTSTTYSATVKASATALKVGQCANAIGTADSTGAVTATRVAVTAPRNGSCSVGFGGRRGGTQSGPGGGTSGS